MYVRIEDLSFAYQSERPVLNRINFSMQEGEVVAILGASGSGKSTLLRLLSGLEMPDQGCITINESTLCSNRVFVAAEKREVGLVFQDYALFPHMSLARNVAFGLRHLKKAEREARIDAMLTLVDMMDFKNAYPHEISGGQQQRIALARALAPNPDILLLDEPFSNLDADLKERIRLDLRTIIERTHMTCIVVTHDYDDATGIADRIVYLDAGHIVKEEIVQR
jgi:iron(III) transport system ATP-binding protein